MILNISFKENAGVCLQNILDVLSEIKQENKHSLKLFFAS